MGDIFKAYDIRGAYPDELDEVTARKIGSAFVRYLHAHHIVVGRDMRPSSPGLCAAFIEGAMIAGAAVTDSSMTSTPCLYYSIIAGEFDGGAMITASHLPSDINGIKLCRAEAIPLSADHGLPEVEKLTESKPGAIRSSTLEGSCGKPLLSTGIFGKGAAIRP